MANHHFPHLRLKGQKAEAALSEHRGQVTPPELERPGALLRNTTAASQGATMKEMEQSMSSRFLAPVSFSRLSCAGNTVSAGREVHCFVKQSQTKKGT